MIEQPSKKKMLLFAGSSNPELAEKVAGELGTSLALVDKKQFASGEIYIRLEESARGADCFVMQSHSNGVNFTIMEQLLLVDALKRASAKRITAVLPFYPYSRQDKKALPREPISARLIGDLFITAGADRPETKNSNVGSGSKIPHLSYVGDADLEENVNFSAGSITVNYDGKNKHRTEIKKDAFVGSDVMLVAPVTVGEGAMIGAGSVITKDVPPKALGIERNQQKNIDGYMDRKKPKDEN